MNIYFFENSQLYFESETETFSDRITKEEVLRYIKTRFTNKERFMGNFIGVIKEKLEMFKDDLVDEDMSSFDKLLDFFKDNYDKVTPFSYREAFEIRDESFKSLVFGSIRVPEMIKELGSERIAVQGKLVNHKQFDHEGNFTGMKEYDVVYEIHKVDGTKLGIREDIYAVRCWCTSTDEEHWLWVDDEFCEEPLEAIARTFVVHENIIPYIKEIKRQGDVMLVEMKESFEKEGIVPEGNKVGLTAEQYFGLLTAQS